MKINYEKSGTENKLQHTVMRNELQEQKVGNHCNRRRTRRI